MNIKKRVTKDFNETLETIIRSSTKEEMNIINDRKPEESKEFPSSTSTIKILGKEITNQSKNELNKYGGEVDSTKNNQVEGKEVSVTKRFESIPFDVKPQKSVTSKNKYKSSKYFQRFFPTFTSVNVPFERSTLTSLPYHLHIELENNGKILLKVTEFYKINKIKSKIYKRKNTPIERQAIFYKEKRLEGENMLYICGIQSNSKIEMRICESIIIYGTFDSKVFSLTIYTSETIFQVKESFATMIGNIDPFDIELQYNDLYMEDNNEIFLYNVKDKNVINISLAKRKESAKKSPGYKTVETFFQMTDDITKCNCHEIRMKYFADLYLLMLDNSYQNDEIDRILQFLHEFDSEKNYHHFNCFKLASSAVFEVDVDEGSSVSEISSTDYTGSDNSLKSAILAENKRIENHDSIKVNDEYIRFIAQSEDFKEFKNLIKNKIGTKCNLRNVALLYKYARETVRFLGFNTNENSKEVNTILNFTKLYFEKYFKKDIIRRGGMDALTLNESYVD